VSLAVIGGQAGRARSAAEAISWRCLWQRSGTAVRRASGTLGAPHFTRTEQSVLKRGAIGHLTDTAETVLQRPRGAISLEGGASLEGGDKALPDQRSCRSLLYGLCPVSDHECPCLAGWPVAQWARLARW